MNRHTLPALLAETPLQPQLPALVLFGRDENGKPRAAWFGASDVAAAMQAAATMKMRTLPLDTDEHRAFASQLAAGRVFASGRAFTPYVRKKVYARLVEIAGGSAGLCVAEALPAPSEADEAGSGVESPVQAETSSAVSADLKPQAAQEEVSAIGEQAAEPPTAAEPDEAPAATVRAPRPGAHLFVGEAMPGERDQIGLGSIVLAHEGPEDGWWEAEVIGCNGRVFSLRWRDFPTQPTILRKAGELALLPPGEA